ncbi:hypothetical protein GYMLUDRAFT_615997 [Collybiopsis luxurians FD-317 M1]|uniref:Uncharacterized protein n=1 Tax=Collybiopsis luxurians FD-317 M1 TaxID=944289 RepID=A0A0D0BW27_9AGAR|nr:hypothetical protein GYMLUDRAFT_615997 [Collybiopsis luxurians FD-317 M1]
MSTTLHASYEHLFGASSKPLPHEITRRTRSSAATDRVLGARRRFEEVSSSTLKAQQMMTSLDANLASSLCLTSAWSIENPISSPADFLHCFFDAIAR